MINFSLGDVVLVKFPFTDLESSKKRPALVLNSISFHKDLSLLCIAMITSKVEVSKLKGDVLLKDWVESNLLHPSLLRLSKIATVESKLAVKKIGKLSVSDTLSAKKEFNKVFKELI